MASDAERHQAESISPAFEVQAFHLADGTLRYYAKTAWNSGDEYTENEKTAYALAAWIAPLPTLHMLAAQTCTSPYDDFAGVLPDLLNVVDLGGGKTGIVVGITAEDSGSLDLMEYRDGADPSHVPILQSIGAGE